MPSDPPLPPQIDPAEVERLRAYMGLLPQARAACLGMMEAIGGTDLNAFPVPKQAAFGLVARSVGNLEAVDMLLKAERIVEARTIARCIVENLFLIASIHLQPDLTMEILQNDRAKSLIVRASILTAHGEGILKPEQLDRAQTFVQGLRDNHPQSAFMNQKRLAAGTFAETTAVIYGQLSDDAAHATITSLGRHIRVAAADTSVLVAHPEPSVSEACDAASIATHISLGLLLAVRDIFGGDLGSKHIAALDGAYRAVKSRWPIRPDASSPSE